ncbi:hypothetical protein AB3S75_026515 [Citrus x aurantiifolia]
MSHGIVSPAAQSNFLNHSKSSIPIASSMLAEASSCLSFNPHLPKLSFSLKTQSGSLRRGPIRASAQSLSAATESFYDLLGIPQSVTPREIKQAYKHLVLKYHPDVSPPERIDENTKRFIRLQEAYETLSDPNTRALYDNHLATGSFIAFSSRKPSRYKEGLDDYGTWRIRWQSQLTELKRRSMNKDSRDHMSWGSRIRRRHRSKTTADDIERNSTIKV